MPLKCLDWSTLRGLIIYLIIRLGYGDHVESKSAEEEVNEYLSRAIDARDTKKLARDNMVFSLGFRRSSLELKVEKP